ncbi:MAG: hypothetical protein AB1689_01075, partial [Thermodesulfobacteriota bacterium]
TAARPAARRPALALRARRAATPGAEIGRTARSRATRLNLLAGLVVLLAALLHAWTGLTVNRLGYELSHAHELSQRLDRQLNELRIEYSAMTKPELLAEEARRRLGLDWPQSGQVVELP